VPFFGAFEEQYSVYGPRMQRKRAFSAPERRRQSYVLQAPRPYSFNSAESRDSWPATVRSPYINPGRCCVNSLFGKCSLIAVAAILALQACGAPEQSDRAASADRIFTNARVYTVNSQQSWAEAVAVSGNEIVYVGENAGALE
jgi:hypothetical protein